VDLSQAAVLFEEWSFWPLFAGSGDRVDHFASLKLMKAKKSPNYYRS
jgi:hypothetical protein